MKEESTVLVNQLSFFVTPMISDHAVLQRNEPIVIRGGGQPEKAVMAELIKEEIEQSDLEANASLYTKGSPSRIKQQGVIEHDGTWRLKFPPLSVGGPYRIRITSEDIIFDYSDIYIGEVWLLSGQSNMQLPIERVKYRFPKVYKNGASSLIRQFQVPIGWNFKEAAGELSGGNWICAVPEDVSKFSAVGFFFAQKLLEQYHIPIGLILTAVGGTPIQAWMSRESLEKYPQQLQIAKMVSKDDYIKQVQEEDRARLAAWWSVLNELDEGLKRNWAAGGWAVDEGSTAHDSQIAEEQVKASEWRSIELSELWKDDPRLCKAGSIWLRKEIEVSPNRAGKPLRLSLGTITDTDFTYINGKLIGKIDYKYPPREYDLSGLPEGKNTIVFRVVAVHGTGGFTGGKKHALIW